MARKIALPFPTKIRRKVREMPKEKSETRTDRPRTAKHRKPSREAIAAAHLALEQSWVQDRGAFEFLLSAGYDETCLKKLVSELLPLAGESGVTTRGVTPLRNKVENAALLVLAGDRAPAWVWKYAVRYYKREMPLRDSEVRENPLKVDFYYVANKIIKKAEASNVTLSRETLCKQAIKERPDLGKLNERTLARWAKEYFPEIRSPRGRKPKHA